MESLMNNAEKYPMRILYVLIFLGASVFLNSCSQYEREEVKRPDNFIPKEKFIEILTDIRTVESIIREKMNFGNDSKKAAAYYYDFVFDKHKISAQQFEENFAYYSTISEEIEDINEKVVENFSQMESEIKIKKKGESKDETR